MEAKSNIGLVDRAIEIEFDEIQLSDSTLGEHDASKDGKMAGKKFQSATISSVSRVIEWGKFEGQPSCLLGIDLYFNSSADHIFKSGSYELELVETKNISASSAHVAHFRPESFNGELVPKQVDRSLTASPNISAGGVQLSMGAVGQNTSYTKKRAFHMAGSPLVDDDEEEDEPLCKGVEWKVRENSIQKTGVEHHLRVALLIRHDNKPFVIESRVQGKTGLWGEKPKFLLSKKKVDPVRRIFYPSQNNLKVFKVEDLDEFVRVALTS